MASKDKSAIRNFSNTVGYTLFKKIFFGYILFVMLFTSFQIYREYDFAKKLVEKDMVNIENSFKGVLGKTIWAFNKEKIIQQADAIVKSNSISGIALVTPYDEIIYLKGTITSDFKKLDKYVFKDHKFDRVYKDDLLSRSFELYDRQSSPSSLGTAILFIETNQIAKLATEAIYLILINVFVSAFILWFLFIYFANKILTIPLNKMIEATNDLNLDDFHELKIEFENEKVHELSLLADTLNQMSKRINESYINMKQLTMIRDKQKLDLENANKYKTDFLANMSHELKTPLNSINVISSVMMKNKDERFNTKDVQNLKIINNCGNDLLYLINDVLDISKLEAGQLNLDYTQINCCELMRDIKDMFEPQVNEKGLKLTFKCDENIGDIYTDDNRIKQIVKNLLSNSIKFVKEDGEVNFIVKDDGKNVKVYVKDNGIGIERNKLQHIFDRFKQADGSTTRKYGGTGLGLAICKELLSLLGGEIDVKSRVDVGTIFSIVFPKNKDKVTQEPKSDNLSLDNLENEISKGKTILIFNNDPISFLSIVVDLKKSFEVVQVSNIVDFKEEIKNDYTKVIVDINSKNESELSSLLNQVSEKLILTHSEEISKEIKDKAIISLKKPIDKEELFSYL